MPELKPLPCPACNDEEHMVTVESLASGRFRVFCLCGNTGPFCETEAAAMESWNALPRMPALIAWQFQAAGAALENQRLRAVLKSVEEIVLEAPELNMSNFDEDQVSSLNEAMISICGILLQESARKDQGVRHG